MHFHCGYFLNYNRKGPAKYQKLLYQCQTCSQCFLVHDLCFEVPVCFPVRPLGCRLGKGCSGAACGSPSQPASFVQLGDGKWVGFAYNLILSKSLINSRFKYNTLEANMCCPGMLIEAFVTLRNYHHLDACVLCYVN